MIQLKDTILPTPLSLAQLASWQSEITGTYDEQIALAKTNFKHKNHNKNATFNDVKQAPTEMSSGAKRCFYCEDSAADEIVNIEPKDLFPEKTFDFGNYLYACGFCHRLKSNQFVIRLENQTLLDLVDFKKQHPRFEMKRYFRQGWLLQFDEELHELFIAVPETLNW
jgi:hypothetical protein